MRSLSIIICATLTALAVAQPLENAAIEERDEVTYTVDDLPAGADLPDILEHHPTKTGLLRARWCSGPVTRSCSTCLRSGNCYKRIK